MWTMSATKSGIIVRSTLLLATICFAGRACGTVVHALDLRALVESSDVVAAGKVISISDEGPANISVGEATLRGRELLAVMEVDEVLKGSTVPRRLLFEFVKSDTPTGIQEIPKARYEIFFFQKETTGYRVSDPTYPFLPALPGTSSSSGTPLERVLGELERVLVGAHGTEGAAASALNAIATVDGMPATAVLRRAMAASSGNLRLLIASRLVARDDITGLETVEQALLYPGGLPSYVAQALAGSLGGLRDPKSIPSLERLLKTNNPIVQKSVAIALRQTHSVEALQPLSTLLSNPEAMTRYYAVVGMGEITGQDEWTPAFDEFMKHEANYLSYWRDWAASNITPKSHE